MNNNLIIDFSWSGEKTLLKNKLLLLALLVDTFYERWATYHNLPYPLVKKKTWKQHHGGRPTSLRPPVATEGQPGTAGASNT